MKKKISIRKIPKVWRWVAGIFAGIIGLVFLAALYLAAHWKPIVSSRIREAVTKGTDSLYSISFDDLSMNLLTGKVAVTNIQLKPDTAVYRRLQAKGDAPARLFSLQLKSLIMEGTHPLTAYFGKKLEIDAIIIDRPNLTISNNRTEQQKDTVKDQRNLYQRLPKSIRSVAIGEIVFYDADLTYRDNRPSRPSQTALKHVTAKISGLLIDSLAHRDKQRFYYTRDIFFQVKDYRYQTPDGMYTIRLDELSASTMNGYIRLNGLQNIPKYAPLAFSQKYKVQHDRYDLKFEEILLNGVDFRQLDAQERLLASSLTIDRADARIFMNRGLPPPPIDKWVNFPHVVLRRLKLNTRIDTVFIRRSAVSYTEFNPKSGQSGTVFFRAFNGRITHVTNDSLSLLKNHHAVARVSALLMGKTSINLLINFNLTDPDAAFSYSGYTANLDLTDLNPLSRPMSLLEIKSGMVKKAVFNVQANRYGSTGTLRLYYNDLKINLLKKDDESGALKKKGVLSLLANAVLVKNDNPSEGEPLRTGAIKFERPPSSSFFNQLWKGVFVGIKESIGLGFLPEKAQAPTEKTKADKKQERKERRADRRQKRQERRNAAKKVD